MDHTRLLPPVFYFLTATVIFFIGMQRTRRLSRISFASLHIAAIVIFFRLLGRVSSYFSLPLEVVAFLVGWSIHTSGNLLFEKQEIPQQLLLRPWEERVRTVILLWTDFRVMQTSQANPKAGSRIGGTSNHRERLKFGAQKGIHAVILLILHRWATQYTTTWLGSLAIVPHDFSPTHQGLLPWSLEEEVLALRSVYATQWVWRTYFLLTAWHDIFAILFVSILGWSNETDWPSLYPSSIFRAYSLRRFWGVFWHRLHVAPFARFTPSRLKSLGPVNNAVRTLWIFLLSALCHGAVNWVVYY
ncbi:hypothetical protein M011DRAFT_468303, partial [Sporormia fimetaria CBS 119925]